MTELLSSGFTDAAAHEWNLVKLGGKWYHCDVTYENGLGGWGLIYFGMTNDERAFDYPISSFNILNSIRGGDVPADDMRFADLHTMTALNLLERTEDGTYAVGNDADGNEFRVAVEPAA